MCVYPEHVLDQGLRENFSRGPASDKLASRKYGDPVAETGSEIKIMNGDDCGYRKVGNKSQEVYLVLDVKMICRFVKDEYGG